MNELEEIKNWLNSDRDYDRGIMLHIAYFKDPSMRLLLERSRNPEKLFSVMLKRFHELKELVSTPVAVKEVSKPKEKNIRTENIIAENADNILQPLNERWGQLKLEMETWHTEMYLIHENNPTLDESQRKQCAGLAGKIIEHEAELQKLSLAFNHVKLYGKLPDGYILVPAAKQKTTPSSANMNAAEKVLMLKNSVNPNISKLKTKIAQKQNGIEKLAGRKHEAALEQINKWLKQLEGLEQQKKELLS